MNFDQRYAALNPHQRQAVDTIDGPVMVIAGPGTGKTELLSMRAANILRQTDALPQNILCLTFTEAGQIAMQKRLAAIIGSDGYKIAVHTFHGFASEIMSRHRQYFYAGADFRPAEELTIHQLLSGIIETLAFDNPLKSTINGEFTALNDIRQAISELKRSGLTDEELRSVLEANDFAIDGAERLIRQAITGTIKPATADALASIVAPIADINEPQTIEGIPRLSTTIVTSLEHALAEANAHPKTTPPLTAWKNAWLTKDASGELVLKSRARQHKLHALVPIYAAYRGALQAAALYDFDDMIIQLIHALETQPELRFDLQEQYQYIMVDEFQDTNLAQMRILRNLTNNPVLEDKPNLLVVGDDDQAIYSFQGAEVGNILTFRSSYPASVLIPLTDNYRSAPIILDSARAVITQGADRLEAHMPELDKTLQAHAVRDQPCAELIACGTASDERSWIIESIASDIAAGVPPRDIAVITRRHQDLEALVPHFVKAGIAISYDRRDNVLDNEAVAALIVLARIVTAVASGQHDHANALMPQLLAHPAWAIDASIVWSISLEAYRDKRHWLEIMHARPATAALAAWLVACAKQASEQPLELMCDLLIGHAQPDTATFISPLKTYFFDTEPHAIDYYRYTAHLTALRTIRSKLRDFAPSQQQPKLPEFVRFIELHQQTNTPITSLRHIGDEQSSVALLTAHAAKGLEFDSVYVMNAVDSVWGERARTKHSTISYPENLRLRAVTNTLEERLRLFFVAMTRAKRQLRISFSHESDASKEQLRASFLEGAATLQPRTIPTSADYTAALLRAESLWYETLVDAPAADLQTVLKPHLASYRLSATHLCAFLDVTQGGPRAFLMNQLLHFPAAQSPAAAYGSAIHETLQRAHNHLGAHGDRLPVEDVFQYFEQRLTSKALSEHDHAHYLQKGMTSLDAFLAQHYDSFAPNQRAELSFAQQAVSIHGAGLKGTLDVVEFDKATRTAVITDYKTGSPLKSWGRGSVYDKIKSHHYRQQLTFYDLLLGHSRDYSAYTVAQNLVQFVEPDKAGQITQLELHVTPDDRERLVRLIDAVWRHIMALDLPDTSSYEATAAGIEAFENDLIDGKI